jgi:allantoin racemase
MRILIINPNSSYEMTQAIQKVAKDYAKDSVEVACKGTPGAPVFIETYEDIAKAGQGMIQLLRKNEQDFDAFIVACHYDPHLGVLKKLSHKPVVGIGQASMIMASLLGHSFSLITTDEHSIPIHEELIRKYHLDGYLVSIRAPWPQLKETSEHEQYMKVAQVAVSKDRAEVLVLGCAGLAGLDKYLQQRLGVPVLDGIICALIFASGLARI